MYVPPPWEPRSEPIVQQRRMRLPGASAVTHDFAVTHPCPGLARAHHVTMCTRARSATTHGNNLHCRSVMCCSLCQRLENNLWHSCKHIWAQTFSSKSAFLNGTSGGDHGNSVCLTEPRQCVKRAQEAVKRSCLAIAADGLWLPADALVLRCLEVRRRLAV